MSEKLLPCPFCSEETIYLNQPAAGFKGSVNCPSCLASIPWEIDEAELVRCWNTRPSPQQPEAQAGVTEEQIASIDPFGLQVDRSLARVLQEGFLLLGRKRPDEDAKAMIRAILALLPQAGKSDAGWMPIESAPKDGTEVVGCFYKVYEPGEKPTMYGPWTIGFNEQRKQWMAVWDGALVIECQTDFGIEYKEPDIQPTHWRPLPPAPGGTDE